MTNADNALTRLIRAEIQTAGTLSCARFMELALYHPVSGFYHRPAQQIGCQGHFYTSVSVGPLFGQFLAFQFAEWLELLSQTTSAAAFTCGSGSFAPQDTPANRPDAPFQIIEAGAHDGGLALDILSWLQAQRPQLLSKIQYILLEPSPAFREAQVQKLRPFFAQVRWLAGWRGLAPQTVRGVIFANELLDAFPAYRIGWDAASQRWFEWRVTLAGPGFGWVRSDVLSPEVAAELRRPFWETLPPQLLRILPDGFSTELCPAARHWWSEAVARLNAGKILTLDYGMEALEFFQPQRSSGTLRGFRDHRLTPDALADPGRQDLTTHINFSELQAEGVQAGLHTVYFGAQESFLVGTFRSAWADLGRFGSWTPEQTRQFQTLTHPQHLGRLFRVLVQERPAPSAHR